jgi:hypothetical protein
MASAPPWKVYSADGEYVAACKDIEDAAALVAFRGDGAQIRYEHRYIVWREGAEQQPAAESYDYVASMATARRLHAARRLQA